MIKSVLVQHSHSLISLRRSPKSNISKPFRPVSLLIPSQVQPLDTSARLEQIVQIAVHDVLRQISHPNRAALVFLHVTARAAGPAGHVGGSTPESRAAGSRSRLGGTSQWSFSLQPVHERNLVRSSGSFSGLPGGRRLVQSQLVLLQLRNDGLPQFRQLLQLHLVQSNLLVSSQMLPVSVNDGQVFRNQSSSFWRRSSGVASGHAVLFPLPPAGHVGVDSFFLHPDAVDGLDDHLVRVLFVDGSFGVGFDVPGVLAEGAVGFSRGDDHFSKYTWDIK